MSLKYLARNVFLRQAVLLAPASGLVGSVPCNTTQLQRLGQLAATVQKRQRDAKGGPVAGTAADQIDVQRGPSGVDQIADHTGRSTGTLGSDVRADPAEWLEGMERLRAIPCPADVPQADWGRIVVQSETMLQTWGTQLARLGWKAMDLFGAHPRAPLARLSHAGLVLLLIDREIIAVTESTVVLRARSGGTQVFRSKPEPDQVLIWELPR